MIPTTEHIDRLRRATPDTLSEIAIIRQAQRERGWKLIRADIDAFAEAEANAEAQR